MNASEPHIRALCCHAATPASAVAAVSVGWQRRSGIWRLDYRFVGDPERIVLSSSAASGFAEGLWRHTCAEAFIAGAGGAYREFNFSPDGRWAIFDFAGERQRVAALSTPARGPEISWRRAGDALRLTVDLPAEPWPAGRGRRAGFCAVVEEAGGRLSYWALAHAADRPDFHKLHTFVGSLSDDD